MSHDMAGATLGKNGVLTDQMATKRTHSSCSKTQHNEIHRQTTPQEKLTRHVPSPKSENAEEEKPSHWKLDQIMFH